MNQPKTATIHLSSTRNYLEKDGVKHLLSKLPLTDITIEELSEQLTAEGYTVTTIDDDRDEGM